MPPFRMKQFRHPRPGQEQQANNMLELGVQRRFHRCHQPLCLGGIQVTVPRIIDRLAGNALHGIFDDAGHVPAQSQFERPIEQHPNLLDRRGSEPLLLFLRQPLRDGGLRDFVQPQLTPAREQM